MNDEIKCWPEALDVTLFESGAAPKKKEPEVPVWLTRTIHGTFAVVCGCVTVSAVAGTIRLMGWMFGN